MNSETKAKDALCCPSFGDYLICRQKELRNLKDSLLHLLCNFSANPILLLYGKQLRVLLVCERNVGIVMCDRAMIAVLTFSPFAFSEI